MRMAGTRARHLGAAGGIVWRQRRIGGFVLTTGGDPSTITRLQQWGDRWGEVAEWLKAAVC